MEKKIWKKKKKKTNLGKCREADMSDLPVQLQERSIWVSSLSRSLKRVWISALRRLSSETDPK